MLERKRKEGSVMNAATIIAIITIAVILFLAAGYIYREKKKGRACIGCPYADSCPRHRQEGNSPCCCGAAGRKQDLPPAV